MSLKAINERYENIMKADIPSDRKAKQLADLMTEMEGKYNIPMIRKQEFENENRKVIALYRKISMSREF